MTRRDPETVDADLIVDRLYDIALDPGSLDDFIDTWNEAGLDTSQVRQTIDKIDTFDKSFAGHLQRAEKFLGRNADGLTSPLADVLAPFENSAAVVLDKRLTIVALNSGASSLLGLKEGGHVRDLPFPQDQIAFLDQALRAEFGREQVQTRLLKLMNPETGRPVLFHARRLAAMDQVVGPHILVVSTQYFWKPELSETLIEVFELTQAELGVVRGMVEGRDAKSIAAARGTSEGTVRSQIKSILAKMSARSQSEVILLVMSLRDVINTPASEVDGAVQSPAFGPNWLQKEAEKPLKSITLPDGRRMDYHDQGPPDGAPVLFSHMGYGQLRWTAPMLKLAFRHRLRVICPVRAGYGQSTNIDRKADVLATTREDTLFLMDHLGIDRLPYVAQGNDLIFAVDLAAIHPERIPEIIGICARPCLPGDKHYAQMGKWHRFFLSTAKHSPHLLYFTAQAAFTLARKIGIKQMFQNMNSRSPADFRLTQDRDAYPIMEQAGRELIVGAKTNAAQAYTMEILATESDWCHLMHAAKGVPIWSVNGAEDPALDIPVIAEYREHYPWMKFEVVANAGQMLMFQEPDILVPRIAEAAFRARQTH